MSREIIIARLRSIYGITNDDNLMNELQDHGKVSDEAVKIEDVSDRDLMLAYNDAVTKGPTK